MTSWHSYPKVYGLGHAALTDLLGDDVVVQEKVDGSQFSFGVFEGVVRVRSKGKEFPFDAPEQMFAKAVEWVVGNKDRLRPDHTYRGEYLLKPLHNTLAYDRIPKNHIVIFDINHGEEKYFTPEALLIECARLDLEAMPLLYRGPGVDVTLGFCGVLLEIVSFLGGQKIEGIVIKNYSRFGKDGKVLMGKHVSEDFKEVHSETWKSENPSKTDFIIALANKYKTTARWNKAVQHLKEAGVLAHCPTDIGKLIIEAKKDLRSECAEEIKQQLFDYFIPKIERNLVHGLPEWYKKDLLEKQFEKGAPQ